MSFLVKGSHSEPLSTQQRRVAVALVITVCTIIPLFALIRPVYVPLAIEMSCISALAWLLARARKASMVPFWLALVTTIVTSSLALQSLVA